MRLVLATLTLAIAASAADAQRAGSDSSEVLSAARRAQQRFELVRRANLPWEPHGGSHPCDIRIGMYCYWYDPTDRMPDPREPERVGAARRALLATLDSLAERFPTDGILLGKRVVYRLEAGDTAEVAALLRNDCGAAAWWCDALLGLVHHAANDHRAAEQAFDRSLAGMEPERRCRWEDPSPVLHPDGRRQLRDRSCDERRTAAERVWWLGDPLLTTPENDLRTEHLARRTLAELGPDGMATFDLRWNADAEEMLLRYGPPMWWSRQRPGPLVTMGRPMVTGHERVPSFAFLSRARPLPDTIIPRPSDWRLDAPLPEMRYATAYATAWREVTSQLARFRRGDTLVLVGSYDTGGDTLLARGVALLAVSVGPRIPPHLSTRGDGARGVLTVRVPTASMGAVALAAIEIVDTARAAAGRFRTGIAPLPDAPLVLSDLLLHAAIDSIEPAPTLDAVAARALPTTVLTSSDVAMYWEAYCRAPAPGPLTVTLLVERTDRPLLGRINARLGFDDPSRTIRIDWQDVPQPEGRCAARSMRLDLRELPDGDYVLRLLVQRDGAMATTARSMTLRR